MSGTSSSATHSSVVPSPSSVPSGLVSIALYLPVHGGHSNGTDSNDHPITSPNPGMNFAMRLSSMACFIMTDS